MILSFVLLGFRFLLGFEGDRAWLEPSETIDVLSSAKHGSRSMASVREYRQHARERRRLARKRKSGQQRNPLFQMAEASDSFAAEIDRPVNEQKELDQADISFPNPQVGFANFPS